MPDIRKSILTDLIELKFIRSKEIKKNLPTDDFVKNIMPYAIRYIPKIENKMTYIKISNLYHKIISFCKKNNLCQEYKNEIKIMRNFIQYNPNSLKHAAEHKIILLQTYKNKLKNLNRPTDSILILNEIKKQKKIIQTYGSYTIARKTDFELSPAVQTAMKGIIDISNLKKTHSYGFH